MTCIVLAYVIFKMKLFMPQLRFSNGNFRIGDSIPNNQLVNYVHTCQRLAIIGVTRSKYPKWLYLYCTLAYPLRSCMVCYKWTLPKICKLFAEHVSSNPRIFFFSSIIMKVAGMRSRCGQLLFFLPPPSTHNKLPYHYGNVYISMPFLKFRGFSQFVESI